MRLILVVHCIEYIDRMSDLSRLINILDDDGALHLTDSSAGFGSGVICAASPVVPFVFCFLVY